MLNFIAQRNLTIYTCTNATTLKKKLFLIHRIGNSWFRWVEYCGTRIPML